MSDSSALGELVQKIRKDALFSDRSADTMGLIEKKINNGRDLTPMTT